MSNGYVVKPSLLEYARFHGLAENYLNQDPHPYVPSELLLWPEDVRLPDFQAPLLEGLPSEPKFRLDSGAVSLLASCLKPPSPTNWLDTLPDHHRVQKLKVEQPALKTDHGSDMRKIRCRKPPTIAALKLVPIQPENEDNERLKWLRKMRELSVCWDRRLANEKLQTTREVLKILQDTLRPVYTGEIHDAIVADEMAFTKRPRTDKTSPPLLPDESEHGDYIPSSPILQMQLISQASDIDDGMEVVKEEIANQVRISAESITPTAAGKIEQLLRLAEYGPANDELRMFDTDEQSPVGRECHSRLLKLEVPDLEPLTPAETPRGSDFQELVLTLAPENRRSEETEGNERSFDEVKRPSEDDLLAQVACKAAQAVEKRLAEEKLEPADITIRAEVPKLDDIKLELPGKANTSREFLHTMVDKHLKHTCQSFDEATEREMRWAPLPRIDLKPLVSESFEPTPLLTECILRPAFTIKGEDLLWRPDQLRVLQFDEEVDEEELEEDPSLENAPVQPSQSSPTKDAEPERKATILKRHQHQSSPPGPKLDTFDFGSLAGFMDTRKAHKRPRLESEAMTKAAHSSDSDRFVPDIVPVPTSPIQSPAIDMNDLSAPQVPDNSSPRGIIVSSRLLKSHRQLMQTLETRPSPALTVIYRDLGSGTDTGDEPDMIFSPTTAAIFTTLQATTQRSLPGQGSSRPAIFDRMLRLSQLYDRLLVLTTLPPSDTAPLDSPNTCSQLSTLTSFCTSLSLPDPSLSSGSIVQPILIPTSSILQSPTPPHNPRHLSPLYQWTYALILKHAFNPFSSFNATATSRLGLTLLPSETTWELFLRKAGLNQYAAQVVLGTLRKPAQEQGDAALPEHEGEENQGEEERKINGLYPWGLKAFVQMSKEERVGMFAEVLGRRAVERVSGVLDQSWGNGGGYGDDGDGDAVMINQDLRLLDNDLETAFDDDGGGGGIATSSEEAMLVD